ncbi:hypothetical protein CVU82_02405 [Candidatus Falkowbacteria bacterium HGW-Falkowbacteria-1]|uniref:Uncharacterized protein n=1 Tax=Candidatus Falkowbacteria bacterium HGW-Falkowbacteria-1 TaxID=2013768 RepID=A0A2N2E9K7_9BACT|nr:MAG: hypothetical protein CVU82_02405 [Candidatus Falkowbacteria bacterium HGW-Falkowbacteria-1]
MKLYQNKPLKANEMEHLTNEDIAGLSTLEFIRKARTLLAEKSDDLNPALVGEIRQILIKMLTATDERAIKLAKELVMEEINKMLSRKN